MNPDLAGNITGLIAGAGDLPRAVAESAGAIGREVFVLGIEEAFSENPTSHDYCDAMVSLGEIGRAIHLLEAAGCRKVAFGGYLTRPDWTRLRLDDGGAALLPAALAAARQGDDALMRVIAQAFEDRGFNVIGLGDLAPDLIARSGIRGRLAPDEAGYRDMELAWAVAGALGAFDIGQAAAVANGLVLAVEAQEGTDALLARVAGLRQSLRGRPGAPAGILLKRLKPGQDRRLDAPVIGMATLLAAYEAGLAGIAVEAGGTLVLDREALVAEADARGMFLIGIDAQSFPNSCTAL